MSDIVAGSLALIVGLIILAIIIIVVVALVSWSWNYVFGYTDLDENGNIVPEKHDCIKFSDGRLAVIQTEYCNEKQAYETISWFLSKGYNFSAISSAYATDERVFLVRK